MHVKKTFEDFSIKVDLELEDGITGLLGYSGSGKTMTLKMIAGIVEPDSGQIILNGKALYDSERQINLKPQKRNVGLMFQSYALFNHMSVYENIAIGLEGSKKEKYERIMPYLMLLELDSLKNRKPKMLSGGQKQRVALARILAKNPDILMLDEPFSALDSHLKFVLEEGFKNALRTFKGTVLYISHNRQEIYKYCDQAAIMSNGQVVEIRETSKLFDECESLTGAKLTGCRNIAACKWLDEEKVWIEDWQLALEGPFKRNEFDFIGLRDGNFELTSTCKEPDTIKARVGEVLKMPDKVRIELWVKEKKIILTCSQREYDSIKHLLQETEVGIKINTQKLLFLSEDKRS